MSFHEDTSLLKKSSVLKKSLLIRKHIQDFSFFFFFFYFMKTITPFYTHKNLQTQY